MKSEQKLKERVPLKEIQAKRERARIVARFCGYASLVFFIEFVYFFFKLQLSGHLHGAAGYILTSLFVIAIAFHFGKMRSVYVYHNTYKVMQHKAASKRKKQFITWWRIAWDLSVPVMILSYSSIWWTEGVYHWLFSLFYVSVIVAAISYIVLSIFTDDFDPDTCYYPWYNPWYYPWHYPFNNSSDD